MASLWSEIDAMNQSEIALKFDHISLKTWGLSNRTLNALLSYNFKMTVGDVIRAHSILTNIRGLGVAGIDELNTMLSQLLTKFHNDTETQISADQDTIPSDPKIFTTSKLKLLPQPVQNLALDQLHLDTKTHNILVKAGITNIGELYNAEKSSLGDIQGLHSGSLGNVNDSLITLLNALSDEDEVNWFQYWKEQRIQILPLAHTSLTSAEQIIKDLPKIIEEVLQRESSERSWIVIQRRFGLGKAEKLTLEDVGSVYGITRERVRQVEEKALKILQEVFVEQHYAGKNYHIHPVIHQIVQILQASLEAEPDQLILETKLLEIICKKFNISPEKIKSSLFLLGSLTGAQYIEIDYPNPVPIWGYAKPALHKVLDSGIKRLDDFLTRETTIAQTEIDILVHLNKGAKKSEKLTLAQLSCFIDLCASIEKCTDSLVRGKFECLKGRCNQVERILIEFGAPMSVADIARQINHRLVPLGQHRLTETNLLNQIIGDERFAAIGRSGKWGLKSWSHIDTKSILILMEEYLITQNKPATVDEIFTYVSERRPVKRGSIVMYLIHEKNTFAKFDRTTWGLANWSDITEACAWNKEQVADFIAGIFKSSKVKELNYKVLKEALMREANINAKQAQGLLNSNPAIKTRSKEAWGERTAVFQPNYKTILAQAKLNTTYQKVSLRKQIEESAHNILNATPDRQMPMAELIHQIHKNLECSASTAYNYLQAIDSIERLDIPGSTKKICRMKEVENSSSRGTLRQRVSESVRNILEAAPNKQMPLSELLVRLQKEHNCPKPTLYQYIASLDYIERLNIPNSSTKICRIKGMLQQDLFPQIQNIANSTLKEKVERALPFLTEENVDLGLFLLSKEFEATLKAYLLKASTMSKLATLPPGKGPDKWNLNGMVDCAKDNGIITDNATFHYLRQARNDRAHGTMPSLAERQLLMKHVQYIAGLYIDYIKILDDISSSL